MRDLIVALGLILVVEGILLAAFPELTRSALRIVAEMPADQMRHVGIVGAAAGVVLVYVAKIWLL